MALTKRDIERANKRRKYSDGRGLFLSVSASGRKTWAFCYRFPDPSRPKGYREREMNLGAVVLSPERTSVDDREGLTVDEARDRVVELRRDVRHGIDPMADRDREARAVVRQKRDGATFKQVAERFIAMKKAEWDANGTSEQSWSSTFANHVYPKIGAKLVTDLTRLDIRDLLLPIWTTITTTATRLLPRMEEVFEYAIGEGLMSGENPADRVKVRKLLPKASKVYAPKHHSALHHNDLPAFMHALRGREGVAPKALEFLILTTARTSEVTGATWDEFDLEAGVWTIPASRMKVKKHHSGAERPPHRVPLTPTATAILRALPREADNPHVFISRTKTGQGLSNMAMLELLKSDMGYKGKATVHGFRSSFRTWVSEDTSYPDDLAEKALAHEEDDKVVRAYKRTDMFEKRRPMMVDWAHFLNRSESGAA